MKMPMGKVTFIHAADIHLGSILHVNNAAHKRELLRQAVYKSFVKIIDAAIRYKVDFVIISGDTYNGEERTIKASKIFQEQCTRLKNEGINLYIIKGNHDSLRFNSEFFKLPDNVHIFDSEKVEQCEVYKNKTLIARIIGQSYRGKADSREMFKNFIPEDDEVCNIGVLHTQLERQNNNYVPCTLEELKDIKNIDYWALGHIHKWKILNEDKPAVVFSGIPQGRDFGELGIGGCMLVEMSKNENTVMKFIPTSLVVFETIEIDITQSNPENLNILEQTILEKYENFLVERKRDFKTSKENIEGFVIRCVIKGRGKINDLLKEDQEDTAAYLLEKLNSNFLSGSIFMLTEEMLIRTAKDFIELEQINKNNLILNKLNSLMEVYLNEKEKKDEIANVFGGIFDRKNDYENINEEKVQLDDEMIDSIIVQAKQLVLEKLFERSDH